MKKIIGIVIIALIYIFVRVMFDTIIPDNLKCIFAFISGELTLLLSCKFFKED